MDVRFLNVTCTGGAFDGRISVIALMNFATVLLSRVECQSQDEYNVPFSHVWRRIMYETRSGKEKVYDTGGKCNCVWSVLCFSKEPPDEHADVVLKV